MGRSLAMESLRSPRVEALVADEHRLPRRFFLPNLPCFFGIGQSAGSALDFGALQIEDDHKFIIGNTRIAYSQVTMEAGVIVEPPKRRPDKYNETSPGRLESFQVTDGGLIIRGRAPIFSVLLQERQGASVRQLSAQLLLVHQNELGVRGDVVAQTLEC